jgi:Transposase and inactivated derivatives
MPSYPRYAIIFNRSTFHVTWQCHNRSWLLKEDWAKRLYYNLLLKYKDRYRISIYSYCFMSSHPHLTGYCEDKKLFSDLFRLVNGLFARIYNKKMRRRGQVVMDRFKSPRIEKDTDQLMVMFYNDLNPKRARMVVHPKDYGWSSYHYYAFGKTDPLLTPAPSYLKLATENEERRKIYRKMVEAILLDDWKEKKPYSSAPFIGDPEWVKVRFEALQLFNKSRRIKWKEEFKAKFETA